MSNSTEENTKEPWWKRRRQLRFKFLYWLNPFDDFGRPWISVILVGLLFILIVAISKDSTEAVGLSVAALIAFELWLLVRKVIIFGEMEKGLLRNPRHNYLHKLDYITKAYDKIEVQCDSCDKYYKIEMGEQNEISEVCPNCNKVFSLNDRTTCKLETLLKEQKVTACTWWLTNTKIKRELGYIARIGWALLIFSSVMGVVIEKLFINDSEHSFSSLIITAVIFIFLLIHYSYHKQDEDGDIRANELKAILILRRMLIDEICGCNDWVSIEEEMAADSHYAMDVILNNPFYKDDLKYVFEQHNKNDIHWYATTRPNKPSETGRWSYYVDKKDAEIRYRACLKDDDPTADAKSNVLASTGNIRPREKVEAAKSDFYYGVRRSRKISKIKKEPDPFFNMVYTEECPFCKGTVSEDAIKCRHCGKYLVEDDEDNV